MPEIVNLLDRRSKDLTNVARGWANSGGGNVLDSASVRLKSGYQAKNLIFQEIISRVVDQLLAATAAAPDLYKKISRSHITKQDLIDEISKTPVGDPGPVLTSGQYGLLAKQILYKMLKADMQKYGEIVHVKAIQGIDRFEFMKAEGLDDKGLPEIFAIFNSGTWQGDQNYPPVNDIDDMIRKWTLVVNEREEISAAAAAMMF
jgi:hypothetical protein